MPALTYENMLSLSPKPHISREKLKTVKNKDSPCTQGWFILVTFSHTNRSMYKSVRSYNLGFYLSGHLGSWFLVMQIWHVCLFISFVFLLERQCTLQCKSLLNKDHMGVLHIVVSDVNKIIRYLSNHTVLTSAPIPTGDILFSVSEQPNWLGNTSKP